MTLRVREAPFLKVLVLYGHFPNRLRHPPSLKRANVEKKCPKLSWQALTPPGNAGKKVSQTSWQAFTPPPYGQWPYGNDTFQKGASLLVIYNQSVTWTALRQLAMFSTTSSSTCTFWYLCMESFTYLCLFTTVVSYPISSPEKATLDKAFDKAIADAVPCSNSWQKLLISRWYILGGSKERKKNLSRSLEIAWMSSESY